MRWILALILLSLAGTASYAVDLDLKPTPAGDFLPFSLRIAPGVNFPLGQNAGLFTTGAGADISLEYRFPSVPEAFLSASLAYDYAPDRLDHSYSVLSAGVKAGLRLLPLPWLPRWLNRLSLQQYMGHWGSRPLSGLVHRLLR